MATFSYVIVNKHGKEIKGSLDGGTREDVLEELKNSGNTVVSVDEVGVFSREIKLSFLESKPKPRDMAVFCRQFVSIVSAGVPIISALEMLAEQTENKKLSKAISECKKTIERGETLAHAMGEWPEVFSSMFITIVEAGEMSGSLDVSFTRMADQFEKEAKLKATVKKATIYPIIILIIAVGAVALLLTFVVPTFKDVLTDMGTTLPGITLAVLAAADFMQERWYIVLTVIVLLAVGIRVFSHSDKGQHFFGKLAIKLPLIGALTVKTASARMARTLSTLLAAGLPLMDALGITANTMSNIYFKENLMDAREQVMSGATLASQFATGNLFPPLVRHMVHIGEDTGTVENMLDKLADYYDEEVENATSQLMAALEPMIIVFMAVMIGTIVISIVLPMANMYDGLNNL
ncbi:MAG: type II secretion system F family protein [Oscillospiraceae bacterium]